MSDKHHGHMLKRLVPSLEVVGDLSIRCSYHNIHVRFKSRNKKISGNPWPVLIHFALVDMTVSGLHTICRSVGM